MTNIKRIIIAMKHTKIIHDRFVPSSNAFIILPIPKIGANSKVVKIIPMTF